jgi:hypothetical protein
VLLHYFDIAELDAGAPVRFLARHAAAHVLLGEHGDV